MCLTSRHFRVARAGGLGDTPFALEHTATIRRTMQASLAFALGRSTLSRRLDESRRGRSGTSKRLSSEREPGSDGGFQTVLELYAAQQVQAAFRGLVARKQHLHAASLAGSPPKGGAMAVGVSLPAGCACPRRTSGGASASTSGSRARAPPKRPPIMPLMGKVPLSSLPRSNVSTPKGSKSTPKFAPPIKV